MLSFSFNLTPAQTRMLLRTAFNLRDETPDGLALPLHPRTPGKPDHFIPVMNKLIAHGLVTHEIGRRPAFVATDHGQAVADLILRDAREIVGWSRGREDRLKRWKPVPRPHYKNYRRVTP